MLLRKSDISTSWWGLDCLIKATLSGLKSEMCQVNHQDPAAVRYSMSVHMILHIQGVFSGVSRPLGWGAAHNIWLQLWRELQWVASISSAMWASCCTGWDKRWVQEKIVTIYIYKKKKNTRQRKRPEYTEGSANSSALQDRRGQRQGAGEQVTEYLWILMLQEIASSHTDLLLIGFDWGWSVFNPQLSANLTPGHACVM